MLNEKRFTASYSSGKDSTLAIWKAMQAGMRPVRLVMMQNTDDIHAWFHDLSPAVLAKLSDALGIPIQLVCTSGADYEKNFEHALHDCREDGAEVCIFGDIDIEGHYTWGSERCARTGLTPWYPLWHMDRKEAVLAFLDSGFTTTITAINPAVMSTDYLGAPLTRELMARMEREGIDVCGENGEYHSLVTDGPLFRHPLDVTFGAPIPTHGYLKLPVD